ncbi:D-serine ammonia-lyase [Vagococcus elongatus]|uniref:Probable D-serine dehydratase n=1 Tax=Vagococcus elongatus TaxID=180344 RepID=A0A430B5H6_9ENTE|nr:D-serine ammonia-lyase [Vagococcus elongatus]RSU15511.1 D-serine ammonia-lyase [Vagococcus elongatus]
MLDNKDSQSIWLNKLKSKEPIFWLNPKLDNRLSPEVTKKEIEEASQRLLRFAPYIQKVFPETQESNGMIESPLLSIEPMKDYLSSTEKITLRGKLFLKCDNMLPISGSIKARGGIYEVLYLAEKLALAKGLLQLTDDYAKLAEKKFRDFFSGYSITVGSTGNLGLSIGIMGAKLGFRVSVHMSADARQWKKNLLRQHGAQVVEYAGDYQQAVDGGRKKSENNPNDFFIDDENSMTLFLGYATAARRVEQQLKEQKIVIDSSHPLFLYLPCGVGGAPGGITYGFKEIFGEHVHCIFAEPIQVPSMLLGVLTGKHHRISVQDIGLDGKTAADGLAVGRPSKLVGRIVGNLVDAFYTCSDDDLYELVNQLYQIQDIFVEPSAAAGFPGVYLAHKSQEYMNRFTKKSLDNGTHIVWATGGNMVPQAEREKYLKI